MPSIDLSEKDRIVIDRLLKSYFPQAKILIFGSRIDGRAKKYSDLDIALDIGVKISFQEFVHLEEALAQTEIPFKIDILDLNSVGDDFKKHILSNHVVW